MLTLFGSNSSSFFESVGNFSLVICNCSLVIGFESVGNFSVDVVIGNFWVSGNVVVEGIAALLGIIVV